ERIRPNPENTPNRLSATVSAHRSAAQHGQYPAPMYSTSGLPFTVSGVPGIFLGAFVWPVPAPTVLSVLAGTCAIVFATAAAAEPCTVFEGADGPPPSVLARTNAITIAATATVLPPVTSSCR